MDDDHAAAAADTTMQTAPAAPAASPFVRSQLPTGSTLHSVYLRGISGAQCKQLKAKAAVGALDFAFLRGEMIVSLFQVECAAVRASMLALRKKLKTKNIHSELVFGLSHTGHFETALSTLTASPRDDSAVLDVLCCCMHATDAKLAALQELLAPLAAHVTPMEQIRQHCNVGAITKTYNIKPTELQIAFPPASDPALAASSAFSESASPTALAQDPLLLAVIGRISTKV